MIHRNEQGGPLAKPAATRRAAGGAGGAARGGKAKAPAGGGAARVRLPDANGTMRSYKVGTVVNAPNGGRWRAGASGWSYVAP